MVELAIAKTLCVTFDRLTAREAQSKGVWHCYTREIGKSFGPGPNQGCLVIAATIVEC